MTYRDESPHQPRLDFNVQWPIPKPTKPKSKAGTSRPPTASPPSHPEPPSPPQPSEASNDKPPDPAPNQVSDENARKWKRYLIGAATILTALSPFAPSACQMLKEAVVKAGAGVLEKQINKQIDGGTTTKEPEATQPPPTNPWKTWRD